MRGEFQSRLGGVAPTAFGIVIGFMVISALVNDAVQAGASGSLLVPGVAALVLVAALAAGARLQHIIGRHDRDQIRDFLESVAESRGAARPRWPSSSPTIRDD